MTSGSYPIGATSPSLPEIGIRSVYRSVRIGILQTVNGFNWQPICSLDEHEKRIHEIAAAVFPEEPALPRIEDE